MLFTLVSLALAGPEPAPPPEAPEAAEPVPFSELPPVLDPAAVPMWPDMRRFRRHHDATVVGLAIGAVGGIVLAAALPDSGRLLPLFCASRFRSCGGLTAYPAL